MPRQEVHEELDNMREILQQIDSLERKTRMINQLCQNKRDATKRIAIILSFEYEQQLIPCEYSIMLTIIGSHKKF